MGDCFLHGWGMAGGWHEPGLQVVSMYVDQQADSNPHDDTSETGIHRQRAEEFGFELYDDIAETLRCVSATTPHAHHARTPAALASLSPPHRHSCSTPGLL